VNLSIIIINMNYTLKRLLGAIELFVIVLTAVASAKHPIMAGFERIQLTLINADPQGQIPRVSK